MEYFLKRLRILFVLLHISVCLYSQTTGKFIDPRDNKCYKTIHLGEQIWFAENLAFNISNRSWAYNNCDSLENIHGLLYEFDAAQQACPEGWHLPTLQDWQALFSFLGMSDVDIKEAMNWSSGSIADTLMKVLNISYSGHRGRNGSFSYIGNSTDYWIDKEIDETKALRVWLASGYPGLSTTRTFKKLACSVRCVNDSK